MVKAVVLCPICGGYRIGRQSMEVPGDAVKQAKVAVFIAGHNTFGQIFEHGGKEFAVAFFACAHFAALLHHIVECLGELAEFVFGSNGDAMVQIALGNLDNTVFDVANGAAHVSRQPPGEQQAHPQQRRCHKQDA